MCCRFFLTSLFSLQQEKPVQHLWKHALTHVTLIYYTTCWNDCDFCGLLEYCHDLSSPPSETLFCKTLALFTHLHTYYSTVRFGTAGVWWVFGGCLHSWTAFGVILWSTAVLRQNITFFRIDLKIKSVYCSLNRLVNIPMSFLGEDYTFCLIHFIDLDVLRALNFFTCHFNFLFHILKGYIFSQCLCFGFAPKKRCPDC